MLSFNNENGPMYRKISHHWDFYWHLNQVRLIFAPIHIPSIYGDHWNMIVIDVSKGIIIQFDSMNSGIEQHRNSKYRDDIKYFRLYFFSLIFYTCLENY